MKTAVDFLVNVVQSCIAPNYIPKEIIKQAKEMEDAQRKNDFIGGYLTHAMSKNKLPYGIEYLSKVADLEEKAEKLYNKPFKSE